MPTFNNFNFVQYCGFESPTTTKMCTFQLAHLPYVLLKKMFLWDGSCLITSHPVLLFISPDCAIYQSTRQSCRREVSKTFCQICFCAISSFDNTWQIREHMQRCRHRHIKLDAFHLFHTFKDYSLLYRLLIRPL